MRTTLDIDEDILLAAKELAARDGKTAGAVLSELARRGIRASAFREENTVQRNGFEVFPAEGRVVTTELVHRLLEEGDEL